jgi:DNA-3-methyladenine glycosylase II
MALNGDFEHQPIQQETFGLDPSPPFRLDLTAWALRRRLGNRIDQWDGTTYSRVLVLDGQPVKVMVSEEGPMTHPRLLVTAVSTVPLAHLEDRVNLTLQQMLGCATDVSAFATLAQRDPVLSELAEQFQGLKPPRFPTLFEALLNAFACQQVSLEVGLLLLNRLAEKYGLSWADNQGTSFAFPGAERLASASEEQLRELGWSSRKAQAVLELAHLLVEEPHAFAHAQDMSNEEVCGLLLPLRGVGRWTAEYVLLRGLGRIEVFPGDDVGAQKSLQQLLSLSHRPTYEQINALTARWYPYAGFVYFHFLLSKLEKKGVLSGG